MVRPEVTGRIQSLSFDEGATVRKGQVLVVLDAAVPLVELAQAQATIWRWRKASTVGRPRCSSRGL